MQSYSLYIHIPFCEKKCNYCDFTSYSGQNHFIPPYMTALKKEIAAYSDSLEAPAITSVYFGGGTPSILDGSEIEELLAHIRDEFNLEEGMEVSMEVNPGTVNLARLLRYKKAGVNRLSIGAQSFNDAHLKSLGRIHTSSQIKYTYKSARTAGFKNINLDLIFALPKQDVIEWSNNLKAAVSLGPEHISTYNLVIEEGTPFHEVCDVLELPSDEEEALMYEDAIQTLTASGYEHYEISNFAKPGFRCRNNLTYWENREYIGVGAGATSYIASSRFTNPLDISTYIAEWSEPHPLILKDKHDSGKQTRLQEFGETVFLGLRLTSGIDVVKLQKKYGRDLFKKHEKSINEMAGLRLLELKGAHLKLTRKGLLLANEVFEKFV
jgi:oxygen-independent coproporphyrinogen-3 oxidase